MMNTREFEDVVNSRKSERFDLSKVSEDFIHGVIGLVGEAGEVSDILKKSVYKGGAIDPAKVTDECGDCLFYLSVILRSVGSSLDEAMIRNDKKLELRYGKKFSTEKFLNIDKAKEAVALGNATI
jgi:NTP pyrophosphatase (non-canonical NTP hydrolase)